MESVLGEVRCQSCGTTARIKDRPWVLYVDLAYGGTPSILAWKKHRLVCPNSQCATSTWTHSDHRLAARRCRLTTRAAKWATKQVGKGRTVTEVAEELGCDWGVVNRAVGIYGAALLQADKKRLGTTTAMGFDETLFMRQGRYRTKTWCTTVADVGNHRLIELVPSRNYVDVARWVSAQPESFREHIEYGALDLSPTYAAVYNVILPKATQVVDRYHLIRLANAALDGVRRRIQQSSLGHRGHRGDPLYRARKLLVTASSTLDAPTTERLETLLSLGDPTAEVALAWRVKEALCEFYEMASPEQARLRLADIVARLSVSAMPYELRKLGRTIEQWFDKILAYHEARTTNGPTEGLNNLIKRIKRVAFGFSNFENYRIRVLLYAGKPNWRVLDSIVVS